MSHFSVLVIGENVKEQLQPYHEFECTGTNDQYVQNMDVKDKLISSYTNPETTRKMYKEVATGVLSSPWEDRFHREPTIEEQAEIGIGGSGVATTKGGERFKFDSKDWGDGRGYRSKVCFLPDGYIKVELPISECESLRDFVEDSEGLSCIGKYDTPDLDGDEKYGWARFDTDGTLIEAYDRTNPNRKWDWWEVGGRWAGHFALKNVGEASEYNQTSFSWGWSESDKQDVKSQFRSDSAPKKYIDFERMMDIDGVEAARKYDLVYNAIIKDGFDYLTWEVVREKHKPDYDKAREEYNSQPIVMKFNKLDADNKFSLGEIDSYRVSREEYIQTARNAATSTFAIVKDGVWYERAQMGWFGNSHSDTMSKEDWYKFVWETIQSVDDDTMLTVVDCHI
jgi:hypothetical protein